MGIRFYCPNGHKLHVKAFQAGRRGICPHCGVSMEIPVQSTRPSSKRATKKGLQGRRPDRGSPSLSTVAGPAGQQPFTNPVAGNDPAFAPVSPDATGATSVSLAPDEPGSGVVTPSPMTGLGSMSSPSACGAEAAASDPLAEAPSAVWYVRPASGGQFGPASRDVMGRWLAEGRVSADSVVWREGWRDWREAGAVFPHLGGGDFVPGMQEILPTEPLEYHPVTAAYSKAGTDKSGARFGLIVAIVVGIALLLLAAILWWLQSG